MPLITVESINNLVSITVGTEEAVDDPQPMHHIMERQAVRGRKRPGRPPKNTGSKRGRRASSQMEIPMMAPPQPPPPPEPVEKPDANMCLKVITHYKSYRDFKYFDYNLFDHDIRSIPWDNIFQIHDIDSKVLFLNRNLLALLDAHAPLKQAIFTRPHMPWITDTVKLMQSLQDKALRRYKLSKNPSHWDYYKLLRNTTNRAIKSEKKGYFDHVFKCNSSKALWKELKRTNVYHYKKSNNIPIELQDVNKINSYFIKSTGITVEIAVS